MGLDKQNLEGLRIEREPEPDRGGGFWVMLGVVLIVLAIGVGYWFYRTQRGVAVAVAVAREAGVGGQRTVLNASGYVTARRAATVSSKVTGKIVEVLVEEGMTVAEGQVLARLDVANVEASLKLAEAQLQVARTTLEETRVRLKEAELELGRASRLVREGVATQSELDRAQAEADSLRARLARQGEEVTVAEKQITLWKQELEDRVIRAPFTGVVVSKDAQPGEMISPVSAGGGFTRTGVCTIVDMGSLEIEVDVNESYINRVEAGQPVEATLDAYTEWKIPGKVIAIIPTADRQKATVKVRIGFEELDPRILPDMGVKVAFRDVRPEAPARSASVFIPKAAARRDGSQAVVFVLNNGQVERRAVTLGEENGGEITVLAGINPGDRVVVNGPADLAEGTPAVEKKK